MDKKYAKWIAGCASAWLLTGTALSQVTPTQTTSERDSTVTAREAGESTHFCRSKDLVGANVKDSQGQKLGDISEIYLSPRTGQAFAAIDVGQRRHAVVPLQAFTVTSPAGAIRDAKVTLNKTKAELESGPVVTGNDWQKLDDGTFTKSIYSHYNLQEPSAAMGGVGDDSLGGSKTGSSVTNQPSIPDKAFPHKENQ